MGGVNSTTHTDSNPDLAVGQKNPNEMTPEEYLADWENKEIKKMNEESAKYAKDFARRLSGVDVDEDA